MHPFNRQAVTVFGKGVVISGNEFSHLLPELGRCLSGFLFKNSCEIGLFIITQLKPDFGNGLVSAGQLVFCLNQFPGFNDLGNALLQYVLTDQVQVP